MASEQSPQLVAPKAKPATGTSPIVYVALVMVAIAAAFYGYSKWVDAHPPQELTLTPEGKAYTRSLQLADVQMTASDSWMEQRVVEITGKITNAGDRQIELIEIYCIFRDPYQQMVLRKRVPIVNAKMGGLKPGATKTFRLPFDELPQTWNQVLPQLVIAAVKFS